MTYHPIAKRTTTPHLTISIPATPGPVSPGVLGLLTPGFLRVLDASISPGCPDGATFGLPFSPATLKIANAGPADAAGSDVGTPPHAPWATRYLVPMPKLHFEFDMPEIDDLMMSKLKPVLIDVPEAVPAIDRHPDRLVPQSTQASVPPTIVIEDFIGLEDDVDAMAVELHKLAAPSSDEYELPSFDAPPAATSVPTNDADAPMTPAVRTPRGDSTVCPHPDTSSAKASYTPARTGRTSTSSGKKSPPNPRKKKASTRHGQDNRNCWLLWLAQHRGIVAASRPGRLPNEIMVTCSQLWEELPPHDKLRWQMMSLFRTEVQSRRDELRTAN